MNRTNANYAKSLNRQLKAWDKEGIESDLVKDIRANLEMFYDKYGIETDDRFFIQRESVHLTDKAEAEFEKLLDSFGNKAGSSLAEMKSSYRQNQDRYEKLYNVNSFEEYIQFTDKMKQAANDRTLKNIISSDQIAELYTIASKNGWDGSTIDDLLIFEYQSNQEYYDSTVDESKRNANDPLYKKMLTILKDLEDEEDKGTTY